MANIKEQKLKKLKKVYMGGSVVGFLIVITLAAISLAAMVGSIFYYMMDSKLSYEHDRVTRLAALYEITVQHENDDILNLLNSDTNVYIIVDENDNVIKEHGKNTCDLKGGVTVDSQKLKEQIRDEIERNSEGEISISGLEINETIYPDLERGYIKASDRGSISIDLSGIKDWLSQDSYEAMNEFESGHGNIELPFWIPVTLSSGDRLIGKAHFIFYIRDIVVMGFFAVAIVLMLLAVFIIMMGNVRKVHKSRRRMTEVFYMDEVTGRHNWMWFITKADQILKKRKNASAKFAVLDVVFVNYRNFCVCHSVSEGEEMLRKVDDLIQSRLGKNELIAHYASANFAAMLTYTDRDRLEERIKGIIRDLEKIDRDHTFNFHVGIYRVSESLNKDSRPVKRKDIDIDNYYNNACTARATLADKDDSAIAFFDEKMVEEQKWIDSVMERQAKAVENEEFLVFYQPKYDPRTGRLRGAEALIRWNSPDFGLVPPGKFIPIFEKNGFITEIDHYMLKHVSQDQKRWLDEGYACVPVSVNVSRAHFIENDLAEQIRDIVDNAGAPHDLIEIELTESAFFDDKHAMIRTILKLKEYGFTVSMDDFGAGYSSLNSLKDMPLDVLKLDADFFRNDEGNGRGQIVVSEAIRLAKNLNMRTVAEGVEIKEQVEFLADQGCDMIQGYYFAKPMPKDEYEQKMKDPQSAPSRG
ncbi:MAG: GGDEF domain-containing phosphodiesterase [Lachnospiraceae bacterium]|nr:GGDEF domain-containing phosphodiesterase [Lachnospiraceae bacterium]